MRTQFGPDGLIAKLYEEDILTLWHAKKFAGEPETLKRYVDIFNSPWPEVTYDFLDGEKVAVCDCPLGEGDYKVVETGMSQTRSVELEEMTLYGEQDVTGKFPVVGTYIGWHAYSKGWDDMSDGGEVEYLICEGCSRVFAMPEAEYD